ncbi:MAG: DUF805 domain-containing protein [Nitrospiraceae bacterium]|nr:MAG: DUF805 domain-containing protein [Nitrospiraceae bacterium]
MRQHRIPEKRMEQNNNKFDLKWFLFSFEGRINRKPFWIYNLSILALFIIFSLLFGTDITMQSDDESWIFALLLLWPSLAVTIKRWHDLNKSGWYILINLIPIVGPIWTFIQTGFIPGTSGNNRYGINPIAKKEGPDHKVFVSGESTVYFVEILLFIFLPLCLIFLLIVALNKGNVIGLSLIIAVFIFLVLWFKYLRNKRVFKIITNDSGISFHGLLKNIYSSWDEVVSIRLNTESAQDVIEVKTQKGNFSFPLFMKNESEEFPKLKVGMYGWKWAYSDGTEQEVKKENCPLLLEMHKYINKS